jgi:sterol desaturase/sphingolipid hydroxylase (fatty acid hydroxylase superfamily)
METKFEGARTKRGDWAPPEPLRYAPILEWPPRPLAFLKWMFGYPGFFLPWGIFYMAVPTLIWLYATPSLEAMKTFEIGWVSYIVVRNLVLILLWAGSWHAWFYIRKAQGTDWKHTDRWLARDNPIFLFRNQIMDNLFWTIFAAVPIWSGYEVLTMWLFANGYIPFVSPAEHPVYFVFLMCAVPLIRDVHYFAVHRISHWGPIYRWFHYLHHNNVNVGPLSGLAMHPVEQLWYWSGAIIHWIIPSHPIHVLFHLQHAALTPAPSHSGFERVVLIEGVAVKTGDFFHYLHHKYFECNYGGDGMLPLDRWFGTFHDGTEEARKRMVQRFLARAEQKAAAEGRNS